MPAEDTEDIKHVVSVICKCERVHYRVEVDNHSHDSHCGNCNDGSGENGPSPAESRDQASVGPTVQGIKQIGMKQGEGKEHEIRPDVQHLRQMD